MLSPEVVEGVARRDLEAGPDTVDVEQPPVVVEEVRGVVESRAGGETGLLVPSVRLEGADEAVDLGGAHEDVDVGPRAAVSAQVRVAGGALDVKQGHALPVGQHLDGGVGEDDPDLELNGRRILHLATVRRE